MLRWQSLRTSWKVKVSQVYRHCNDSVIWRRKLDDRRVAGGGGEKSLRLWCSGFAHQGEDWAQLRLYCRSSETKLKLINGLDVGCVYVINNDFSWSKPCLDFTWLIVLYIILTWLIWLNPNTKWMSLIALFSLNQLRCDWQCCRRW